ncbi:hypothetical protein K1719_031631 [Acacia pycnantha]|nr:hypothetical protein K1719_031631 [Acacia pycnantha]
MTRRAVTEKRIMRDCIGCLCKIAIKVELFKNRRRVIELEAIWCGSTNSTTEEGKELCDPRVLTNVGDVPVQEIRDCGVDDDRLMNVISESVKLVMEENHRKHLVFEIRLLNLSIDLRFPTELMNPKIKNSKATK